MGIWSRKESLWKADKRHTEERAREGQQDLPPYQPADVQDIEARNERCPLATEHE